MTGGNNGVTSETVTELMTNQLEAMQLSIKALVGEVTELRALLKNLADPTTSKRAAQKLPDDVIGDIIAQLPQYDVYPFLLVSKAVNRLARHLLWRHVYVCPSLDRPYLHRHNVDRKIWLVISAERFMLMMTTNEFACCEELVLYNTAFSDNFLAKLETALPATEIRRINDFDRWKQQKGNMATDAFDHSLPELSGTSLEVVTTRWSTSATSLNKIAQCSGWDKLQHLTLNGIIVERGAPVEIKLKLKSVYVYGENLEHLTRFIDFETVKQLCLVLNSEPADLTEIARRLYNCTHICLGGGLVYGEFLEALPTCNLRFLRYHLALANSKQAVAALFPAVPSKSVLLIISLAISQGSRTPRHPWVTFFDKVQPNPPATIDDVYDMVGNRTVAFQKLENLVLFGYLYHIQRILGEWMYADLLSSALENPKRVFFTS